MSYEPPSPKGFLTDVSVCIGCKACEVACRIWNEVPEPGFEWRGATYDHTGELGASSWRHVKFLEVPGTCTPGSSEVSAAVPGTCSLGSSSEILAVPGTCSAGLSAKESAVPGTCSTGTSPESRIELSTLDAAEKAPAIDAADSPFHWIFASDVCKHCAVAGCLEACPTGALVRTEVGSVLVQDDICNGCGYCVVTCPFGVIDRRPAAPVPTSEANLAAVSSSDSPPGAGGAFKCTFCVDRQAGGLAPACATVCPTESILFGDLEELRSRGHQRVETLAARGRHDAHLYDGTGSGAAPDDSREESSMGDGVHSLFVLLGPSRDYGLPEAPQLPQRLLGPAWSSALWTAVGALAAALLCFWGTLP